MTDCYYYKELSRDGSGVFNKSVDCTYVLIMHESPREESIIKTLERTHTTSTVVLQYNYGYKKCDKKLVKNAPNYDLSHAYKTAFKHALDRGYKRILVLEDDCEFDERIHDTTITEDINTFILERQPDIYTLGTPICIPSPLDVIRGANHQLLLFNTSAHAVIYSENFMKYNLKNVPMLGHIDFETNAHLSKYTYKKPIAYQKYYATDNALFGWGCMYHVLNVLIFKPLQLDTKVQPGFDNGKRICDICSIVLFVLFVLLVLRSQLGLNQ